MEPSLLRLYGRALGLGVIAGLRSLTAPALFSLAATRHKEDGLEESPLRGLASPAVATTLCVLAVGEMIADKLPVAPDRTLPPSLAFRAVSGAIVGAAVFSSRERTRPLGAVLGALAAVAGTYVGYHLRKAVDKKTGAPDPLIGLVEDAIAIGSGLSLLRP